MKYPVFIPTKARPTACLTANLLISLGVKPTLVIEPQDQSTYEDQYGQTVAYLTLQHNDRGLSFARNSIKEFCQREGIQFHWQMDDDVKTFNERVNGKNPKVIDLRMFDEIEADVDAHTNIAIAGLRDVVFAWTQKTFKAFNKLNSSVFICMSDTEIRWEDHIVEDVDYSLQTLKAGY